MIEQFGDRGFGNRAPAVAIAPLTRALGFAGLAPAALALLVEMWGRFGASPAGSPRHALAAIGAIVALVYGAVILSFIGGIWWGFAVRCPPRRQVALAILAVLPSLAAAALVAAPVWLGADIALIVLGSLIVTTLVVDRRLALVKIVPSGWMRLRVPLSIGLGGLIIVTGIFAPR